MSRLRKCSEQAPRPAGSPELSRQHPAGRLGKGKVRDRSGFIPEPGSGRGALGIRNMEERAHLVGGSFTLSAQSGKGVAIIGVRLCFHKTGRGKPRLKEKI
jgi:hypothetical protein